MIDILEYEEIFQGLEKFLASNKQYCYNPSLVHYAAAKPTYPYVVFEEIRNLPSKEYSGEVPDKISDLGYKIRIYSTTKGSVTKMTIARQIASFVDRYLSGIGLKQVSFNPDPLVAQGDLYGLVMMYNASFYNNRRKII